MVPQLRKSFNDTFSKEKYEAYVRDLNSVYPGELDFRIAETAVFVPSGFKNKILS